MKRFMCIAIIATMVNNISAKTIEFTQEEQTKLIELNRQESKAYTDLQNAEQGALLGNITEDKLGEARSKYEAAKESLEKELSQLSDRAKIEQWLTEHTVGCNN
jgi:hypothetical protein